MINRLLPTVPFAGMTVDDLLLLELPHYTYEDRVYFCWENTGFPSFFAGEGWPAHQLQQQLRDFRNGKSYYFPLGAE